MRAGGIEGAQIGALYGSVSWYGGPVARAGMGMMGLMYAAVGVQGASQSYAAGYNRGGTLRLALSLLALSGGSFDLYASMNSYYSTISPPGGKTLQAMAEFQEASRAGLASTAEEPAIVKIYLQRLIIEQEIHVPPGRLPVRVLSGSPDKIAVIGRSMEKGVRPYAAELEARGLKVEIFDEEMVTTAAQEEFAQLRAKAKATAPDGRLTVAQIRSTKMFQENLGWAEKLKREGYTVLDLGSEPDDTPSPFYEMEGQEIFGD